MSTQALLVNSRRWVTSAIMGMALLRRDIHRTCGTELCTTDGHGM